MEILKYFMASVVFVASLGIAYVSGQKNSPYVSIDKSYLPVNVQGSLEEADTQDGTWVEKYSYISAYSHIYTFDGRPLEMAVTLSLQNLDRTKSLRITKVLFHNTQGKLIREYLVGGYVLKPLEVKEIFILDKDLEGGSGANFIVEYQKQYGASDAKFETIMTSGGAGKSYVFSSAGRNFLVE